MFFANISKTKHKLYVSKNCFKGTELNSAVKKKKIMTFKVLHPPEEPHAQGFLYEVMTKNQKKSYIYMK